MARRRSSGATFQLKDYSTNFARGELESLGGTFHAVHVPTLELSLEQLAALPVSYLNGRDGRYDEAPQHPAAL